MIAASFTWMRCPRYVQGTADLYRPDFPEARFWPVSGLPTGGDRKRKRPSFYPSTSDDESSSLSTQSSTKAFAIGYDLLERVFLAHGPLQEQFSQTERVQRT